MQGGEAIRVCCCVQAQWSPHAAARTFGVLEPWFLNEAPASWR